MTTEQQREDFRKTVKEFNLAIQELNRAINAAFGPMMKEAAASLDRLAENAREIHRQRTFYKHFLIGVATMIVTALVVAFLL